MANKGGKPSDRRAGKRKDRNKRVGTRVPELGYYLIVTDTEWVESLLKRGATGISLQEIAYRTR